MTQAEFNHELDILCDICQKVFKAQKEFNEVKNNIKLAKIKYAELDKEIGNFQRQCFKLVPIVKKNLHVAPEYGVLLEKLKESIILLC